MAELICGFRVGNDLYALPASSVLEAVRAEALTAVPLGKGSSTGLLNLRGSVIPAVNARALLGQAEGEPQFAVIVRVEEGSVALLVDELLDVYPFDGGQSLLHLDTVQRRSSGLVAGVHATGDLFLCVLNPQRIAEGAAHAGASR